MAWVLEQGDCLEVMRSSPFMGEGTMDSLVSDPPSGTGFMGKDWDCFRRRHNPNDVDRPSVHGRMSAHAPHSYGESDRENFIAFMTEAMKESLRLLKPGAYALVWALPRTSHWTATAMENAGFEIRDVIVHAFGSGFPKSQDVGKFIDKLAGAEREVVGVNRNKQRMRPGNGVSGLGWTGSPAESSDSVDVPITAPASEEAKSWDGWGTALKPASEHWILARKPLSESSIARNVLKHGVGALNIDESRVDRAADDVPGWHTSGANGSAGYRAERCPDCIWGVACETCQGTGFLKGTFVIREMSAEEIQERCGNKGRWPTNLLLSHAPGCALVGTVTHRGDQREAQHGTRPGGFVDTGAGNGDGKPCGPLYGNENLEVWECVDGCPVAELDRQSGKSGSGTGRQKVSAGAKRASAWAERGGSYTEGRVNIGVRDFGDSGGASRFFPRFGYFAKPSRSEREAGLESLPDRTLNRVNPGGIEDDPRWAPVQVKNNHPTVKGKKLMAWLITLITPPGGVVLDPFAGSGSTGVAAIENGFSFVGIEQDPDSYEIAEARIEHAARTAQAREGLFAEAGE